MTISVPGFALGIRNAAKSRRAGFVQHNPGTEDSMDRDSGTGQRQGSPEVPPFFPSGRNFAS